RPRTCGANVFDKSRTDLRSHGSRIAQKGCACGCDAVGSKSRMGFRCESLEVKKPQHAVSQSRDARRGGGDHRRRAVGLSPSRLFPYQRAKAEDRLSRSVTGISRKDAKTQSAQRRSWFFFCAFASLREKFFLRPEPFLNISEIAALKTLPILRLSPKMLR